MKLQALVFWGGELTIERSRLQSSKIRSGFGGATLGHSSFSTLIFDSDTGNDWIVGCLGSQLIVRHGRLLQGQRRNSWGPKIINSHIDHLVVLWDKEEEADESKLVEIVDRESHIGRVTFVRRPGQRNERYLETMKAKTERANAWNKRRKAGVPEKSGSTK